MTETPTNKSDKPLCVLCIDISDKLTVSNRNTFAILDLFLEEKTLMYKMSLQNSDEETALHCAAQHGHSEVVRVLVNRGGADPNIKNCREETPLDLASLYGR